MDKRLFMWILNLIHSLTIILSVIVAAFGLIRWKLIIILFIFFVIPANAWQIDYNQNNLNLNRTNDTWYYNNNSSPIIISYIISFSCSVGSVTDYSYSFYINNTRYQQGSWRYTSFYYVNSSEQYFIPASSNYKFVNEGVCGSGNTVSNVVLWYEWNIADIEYTTEGKGMDMNITNFTYDSAKSVSVNPYNQDMIIVLLVIIAFCCLFQVIWRLIIDIYTKPFWQKKGGT